MGTRRIRVRYDSPWLLAGVVEELRNHGVELPSEAEAIVREALLKINFASYMTKVFPARRQRLVEILERLDVPSSLPGDYGRPMDSHYETRPKLAPFETRRFFADKVLGVGLKSYPYVLDVNRDGKKDLLVGDHDGFIYVFLNEGTDADPVFKHGERLKAVDTGEPLIVRPNPKLSFGDLRGKGCLDLVQGNYGGQVSFLPNRATDGTLAFAVGDARYLRTKSGVIDVGNYAYPELVDWDDRGVLDLVVGNIDGELWLFRNAGRSGEVVFEEGVRIPGIETLMYPHPVFADWNGDGRKDLVLGHREGTILVYLDVGTDRKPRFQRHDVARHADGRPVSVGLLSHPCVVDWDNDGRPDLVVGNDPGQVTVFRNVGTADAPVFDEGRILKDEGGELILGVHSIFAVHDLDGDGRKDLVVGHEETRLRVFGNVGTSRAPAFDDFRYLDDVVVSPERLAAGDPEARRFWDLEALAFNTEYLGNLAPCFVDWDETGVFDLLIGNYTGLIYRFENLGTPNRTRFAPGRPLQSHGKLLRVAGFAAPVVCDWNNDGRKDLVCGDLLGRVHVFLNAGPGRDPALDDHFMIEIDGEPVALGPRSIVEVADLDGDGKKDLLVGNRVGNVYALLNAGTDDRPQFRAIEPLRDGSALWRQLYAGCQYSEPFKDIYFNKLPGPDGPKPMYVVETSCPRVVDYDHEGRPELLVSHRYGRVFDYGPLTR